MAESKPGAEATDVARWVREARARWPLVALGEAGFGAHLERLGRLTPVFPIDVYLAAACLEGDPAALQAFEDAHVSRIPDALRRVDPSTAFAREICQLLRIRLFVRSEETAPRIAQYTGEVPLSAWTRVIATRLAFNAKRSAGGPHAEADQDHGAEMDDPEVDYLRSHYREPFVRSFKAALAALSKDDRTILRLHYVEGVNIDGIGRVFQVHRATVARWLVRIRSDVLARAKVLLAEEVGAAPDEAGSVIGVLAGEIDVTLSRVLGDASA